MNGAGRICVAILLGIAFPPLMRAGALAAATAPATESAAQLPRMTAAQIVEKHIAARGGAQAWKAVLSMQLSGRLDAGHGDTLARAMSMVNAAKKANGKGTNGEIAAASATNGPEKEIQLPFTLVLKRPNRMRMEVVFDGRTSVQVFDGQHGWKLRPFLNRSDAEPFTADEMKTEGERGDLDGPLVNYVANGTKVDLEGTEVVEGQPAYRLKVTPRKGAARHVWIDGRTFLDVKLDGFPRRMDGKLQPVYVYQRDFRTVQGVIIPFVMETAVDGNTETHKLQIEKATINPKLDESLFSKPHA